MYCRINLRRVHESIGKLGRIHILIDNGNASHSIPGTRKRRLRHRTSRSGNRQMIIRHISVVDFGVFDVAVGVVSALVLTEGMHPHRPCRHRGSRNSALTRRGHGVDQVDFPLEGIQIHPEFYGFRFECLGIQLGDAGGLVVIVVDVVIIVCAMIDYSGRVLVAPRKVKVGRKLSDVLIALDAIVVFSPRSRDIGTIPGSWKDDVI
mmetsp:Transcript_15599/g.29585  ORF Transcript_15599/g.29585 Transcript_15599/m.29585 type:complete len:206 (-) Transcript_15599:1068-1685(-)